MNLTPKQLRDRADAIEAYEAGKPTEYFNETCEQWRRTTSPSSMWLYNVHIRPAPAPEPPKPWDCAADLAELGPVIWMKGDGTGVNSLQRLVVIISDDGIHFSIPADFYPWGKLKKHWLYSTDRKTWKPCHKAP